MMCVLCMYVYVSVRDSHGNSFMHTIHTYLLVLYINKYRRIRIRIRILAHPNIQISYKKRKTHTQLYCFTLLMRCFSYKFSFGLLVQLILYPLNAVFAIRIKTWQGICIYISYFSHYYFILVVEILFFILDVTISVTPSLTHTHTHS